METLADSPDKEHLEKILREGAVTSFWKTVKRAIDENIDALNETYLKNIKNGEYDDFSAEECKIRMLIYKEKVYHLEQLKELPFSIVQSFGSPNQSEPELDPYDTKEDFLPKK